uniref:NFACT RNA-binding domain-containing protein n=1 Tax=Alexandrium monilatum TaxID=311494 RepID=A0A7S4SG76_9DINO
MGEGGFGKGKADAGKGFGGKGKGKGKGKKGLSTEKMAAKDGAMVESTGTKQTFNDSDDEDDDEEPAAGEEAHPEEAPAWEAPVVPGWILRKRIHVPPSEAHWANDDFTPLPPDPGDDSSAVVPYPSFHRCVDEFYTQLEEHRAQEQKAQHAQSVYAKVERIRVDQGRRVEQLEAEQVVSERMAEVIEANVELVERALTMLNTMVASQFDWGELWREVKRQQRLGHPLAQHIHAMELSRNEVSLLLSRQPDDDELEADADEPMQVVPLDLSLSARANVARLHAARKQTREKTSKTMAQAEQAIKQAERKAQQDLQKYQLKQSIRRVRQTWWFEKFHWFLSSENYLVLAGRDSAQAEQIFRRHVGPRDVFVHADVGGATSCFVKSLDGKEVPPATLREAGTAVLCRSVAWDKHIVISPWWVSMDQVCKGMPPTSDCTVVSDGFIVQGQRRFLPAVHLEMGLTLLFHVGGEGAAARHHGERKSRYLEAMGSAGLGSEVPESSPSGGPTNDDTSEALVGGSDEAEADGPPEAGPLPEACAEPITEPEEAAEPDKATEAEETQEAAEDEEACETGGESLLAPAASGTQPASSDAAAEEEASGQERAGAEAGSTRPRHSKADRRRLKKGPTAGGPPAGGTAAAASEPCELQPPPRAKPEPAAPRAKAVAPLPRGQRAKQKKIREKYADQDEEERELRLALLGSKATKHGRGREEVAEEAEEDSSSQAAPAAVADGGAEERKPAPAAPSGRRRGGGPPRAQAEGEPVRPGCEADQASELQPDQLDILTGQPQPEDEVLYAIPMVAPYCALSGPYSLRVKLTPGSVKKGQAVKTCLRMFETQLERPTWKQLVQAIPEADTAGMLCGSCKLSMPGLQKLQAQAKREAQKDTKRREREAANRAT